MLRQPIFVAVEFFGGRQLFCIAGNNMTTTSTWCRVPAWPTIGQQPQCGTVCLHGQQHDNNQYMVPCAGWQRGWWVVVANYNNSIWCTVMAWLFLTVILFVDIKVSFLFSPPPLRSIPPHHGLVSRTRCGSRTMTVAVDVGDLPLASVLVALFAAHNDKDGIRSGWFDFACVVKTGVDVMLAWYCGRSVGAFITILMNILFATDLNALCLLFSSVIIWTSPNPWLSPSPLAPPAFFCGPDQSFFNQTCEIIPTGALYQDI